MCQYANEDSHTYAYSAANWHISTLMHLTTRCKDKKRGVNCQAIHAAFLFLKDKMSIKNGCYHRNSAYISYI